MENGTIMLAWLAGDKSVGVGGTTADAAPAKRVDKAAMAYRTGGESESHDLHLRKWGFRVNSGRAAGPTGRGTRRATEDGNRKFPEDRRGRTCLNAQASMTRGEA